MQMITAKGQSSREQLLRGATKVFAEKGYAATRVRGIAKATNFNISMVSYHFDGKRGLYRACLEGFGESLLSTALNILKEPQNQQEFQTRFRMFVEEMFSVNVRNPEIFILVHREIEAKSPLNPDIFEATFLKVFVALKKFVEKSQKKGFYSKTRNAHVVASFVFSILAHLPKTNHLSAEYFGLSLESPAYQKKVVDHLMELFV